MDHPCHVCFKLADWFQRRRPLNNFPHRSYVKTMPTDGGHFGPRSGSLNTILAVDHLMFKSLLLWNQLVNLKQTWHEWSLGGQLSKIYPVRWRSGSPDTSLKIDHLRTIHAMFALNWLTGFRGKKIQLNCDFAGMIIGWSCIKLVNCLPIGNSRWPPWLDLADGPWTLIHDKSSHVLWPGELTRTVIPPLTILWCSNFGIQVY
jgi:hypothetical protein